MNRPPVWKVLRSVFVLIAVCGLLASRMTAQAREADCPEGAMR